MCYSSFIYYLLTHRVNFCNGYYVLQHSKPFQNILLETAVYLAEDFVGQHLAWTEPDGSSGFSRLNHVSQIICQSARQLCSEIGKQSVGMAGAAGPLCLFTSRLVWACFLGSQTGCQDVEPRYARSLKAQAQNCHILLCNILLARGTRQAQRQRIEKQSPPFDGRSYKVTLQSEEMTCGQFCNLPQVL